MKVIIKPVEEKNEIIVAIKHVAGVDVVKAKTVILVHGNKAKVILPTSKKTVVEAVSIEKGEHEMFIHTTDPF